MNKKTKKITTAALVGVVALGGLLTVGLISKYNSEVSGTAEASVAKWAWEIGGSSITSAADVTNGYTFDLFQTIKEADGTTSETDVASGKIAPGTGGSFDLEITNNSEVNATYAIAFTETNTSGIPIEYSLDGGTTWVTAANLAVNTTNIDMGATATKTIQWRWAYTGAQSANYTTTQTDTTDTALGFAANTTPAPKVQVTAAVTVTQRD